MGKGDKKFLHEADVFKALAAHLDAGKSARTFEADSKEDAELIATADLLSLKPIIYAANMDEDGFADKDSNKYYKLVADLAAKEGAEVLPICAKLEQDIAELDGDDRAMFLEELGIEKSGLDRLDSVFLYAAGTDLLPRPTARMSAARGPSSRVRRLRRPPARSTPTSSAASSVPRPSTSPR